MYNVPRKGGFMIAAKAEIENTLIARNDVAAGLINAIFADGVDFVRPEDLRDAPLDATYESIGRLRGLRRDVAKYFVENDRCECVFAFEIQSAIDPTMPVRVLGYDGVSYRDELENSILKEEFGIGADHIVPIFTTVLYFGDQQWRDRRKLSECATMSERVARFMRPFFDDFEIRVVDFAGMSDDELRNYPADIRIIAEYFRCRRNGGEYVPSKIKIAHKRELFYFMQYVVGDERFAYDVVMEGYDKEPEYMCEILDRIEARGKAEGRAEGRAEGIAEGIAEGRAEGIAEGEIKAKKAMAEKLLQKGWSFEETADFLDVAVVDVKIWLGEK